MTLTTKMRKRQIKKIGRSYYAKLKLADLRVWGLQEGDLIGIKKLRGKINKSD